MMFGVISSINATSQTIKISGLVADSLTSEPLIKATITLSDIKGRVLQMAISNKEGEFELNTKGRNADTLSIGYRGFQTKKLALTYDQLVNDYKLGTLLLKATSLSLAEVIITGRRPPVSLKLDRQVFEAGKFANASTGTGTDVIRNLPAVSVNGQGEISFRGSTSFLVLIDGKPTQGDPSFILGQLSAASIESIEVITSPSAVYDADGKSGIINVVTKTGTEDGWLIQSNVMGGLPPLNDFDNRRNPQRYGVDVSAGYRRKKWDVSAGINYLRNDIAGSREGDVYTIINNIKTSFPSNGERSFKRYNYGARIAAAYQADKFNAFSAGIYAGKKYQSRVADLLYNNKRENLTNGTTQQFTYFNENDQEKEGVFTLANLDYVHQFADQSKLSLSLLHERADLSGNTSNNNLYYPALKDTLQYTVNPNTNPLIAYRIKTDYSKTIGPGNLQVGYQYRYDVQEGNFLYLTKTTGTNSFVTDPDFTSDVKAVNHINAAYVQYAAVANKLNYSAGLRIEQLKRAISFSKNSEQKTLSLTNLFPSLQLRYKSWNRGVIKAGYSRRIKRSNNFELNPFPEREHSETLEQGDPELLPELIGTLEAGVEQTLTKGNFFATLYYQHVKNPIQRVNKVYNDTILNRVFTNAGRATQLGLETNLTLQITKVWQSIIGGNIYKYAIDGKIFNGAIAINNNSWVYSINSTQSFTLPKNWLLQFSINYLSERATAQGKDSRFLTPHFIVKKTSNDNRWNFQVQWLNMDAGLKESNRQRITTYGSNFYTTTNYIYEPDQIQFSIGFNLSRKNRKITLPVSEIGEKEF